MSNVDEPERYARAIREEKAERVRWEDVCKDLRKENKALAKTVNHQATLIQWLTAENMEKDERIEKQDERIERLETGFRALLQAFAELEANQ